MNYENKQPIVLISAEKLGLTPAENVRRTENLRSRLLSAGMAFKAVNGRYKDAEEISFAVVCPNQSLLTELSRLAQEFDQDCILYRDIKEDAYLVDGLERTYLGKFQQVTEYTAKQRDGYTYDPVGGGYYIVEKIGG